MLRQANFVTAAPGKKGTSSANIPGGSMASDVYLQVNGIKGESQDSGHKDWIQCDSVH